MANLLWRADELAGLFDLETPPADTSGVSIDTRTLKSGELFIALSGDPGPRFGGNPNARDGHDFVDQAIAAGATSVMVHREGSYDVPVIRVADTLDGLWRLGAGARQRFGGKTIALTGSSGKTTLRGWFEHILGTLGRCHASAGSLNNHWGVPLSLARMPEDCDFAVLEVGTNHPGEIAPLSELVSPDVSLLLNVLAAHIGNFDSMDALIEEKLAIATGLDTGGTLVLPYHLKDHAGWRDIITFGPKGADVTASSRENDKGTELTISVSGDQYQCSLPFHGAERIQSALAVTAVLVALGVDLKQALPLMADLPLPEGRGNLHRVGDILLVDDSYNANPGSMSMSLREFSRLAGNRKFAFLGEMLELGGDAARYHREIAREAPAMAQVYSFGEGFADCVFASPGHHYRAVEDFPMEGFVAQLRPGDCILVKGSNKVFWLNGFVRQLLSALENR